MAWRIEYDEAADRDLTRLDRSAAQRILRFMSQRVATLDDPRQIAQPLKGSKLGEFWRFRVGDYRVIASLEEEVLTVYVVQVGHRKEVYR